jgi:hypothetical protein
MPNMPAPCVNPLRSALLATLLLTAPPSLRLASAADTVDASPTVRIVRQPPAPPTPAKSVPLGAPQLKLRVGEVCVLHVSERRGNTETAFYLPPEGVPYVQISFEKSYSKVTYFARGMRPGKTVGGIVDRRWLDSAGFSPGSVSSEVRAQDAIKARPVFITVQ